MNIPDELARLASAQDGLVTRRQALAHGMTAAGVRHALGAGRRWQRVVKGVYATFTGPVGPRHRVRAALLHAGAPAIVTGAYACRAYGLRYVPDAPLVLLVPATVHRERTPLALLRRVAVMPARRLLAGVPVAVPERAVLDACHQATSLRNARALLCDAVQSGLTTPNRIAADLGAARWKGAGLVRLALDDVFAGCRSAPECELRDLIRQSSILAEPEWNSPLPGATGKALIPDAHWADARVVIEIDSAEWHRFGDRVEMTERRRARYAALGWVVLSISPRRLREEPDVVLAEIEAAVVAGHRTRASAG